MQGQVSFVMSQFRCKMLNSFCDHFLTERNTTAPEGTWPLHKFPNRLVVPVVVVRHEIQVLIEKEASRRRHTPNQFLGTTRVETILLVKKALSMYRQPFLPRVMRSSPDECLPRPTRANRRHPTRVNRSSKK